MIPHIQNAQKTNPRTENRPVVSVRWRPYQGDERVLKLIVTQKTLLTCMCEQGEFDMLNASYPAFKKLIPASDRLFVPERQYQMEGPHQTPQLSVGPLENHIERVKESL